MQLALGLIETKGLIGAIEAADAMAKAASVKIINKEKSTAALVTIKIEGEVAAVKSAIDAGAAAAQRVGQLVSAHIIPRPHSDIDFIIHNDGLVASSKIIKSPTRSIKVKKERSLVLDSVKNVDDKVASKDKTRSEQQSKSVETEQTPSETPDEVETPPEIVNETQADIIVEKVEEEKSVDSEPQSDTKSHLERLREEAKLELDDEEFSFDLKDKETDKVEVPSDEELEKMNVHELRRLARSIEKFPIKGREISKANRQLLLDYFSNL